MKSTFTYLKNFIRDKNVASVTPSTRFCVKRTCKFIDFSQPRTILEFGPGTGVYTRYLLKRLRAGSELHAFELNTEFVKKLKTINNEMLTVYEADAGRVSDLLPERYIGSVDYIISGIPFSFLDDTTRNTILKTCYRYLHEGGAFLAYQTSGHLKEPLAAYFDEVKTEYEILNIPPMMIYRAVKHPSTISNAT